MVPLILLLISTALASSPALAVFLGLQLVFYSLAFAGLVSAFVGTGGAKVFSVPFYVVLGSFGALVGVLDACVGRKYDVWEIPALSRGRVARWQGV